MKHIYFFFFYKFSLSKIKMKSKKVYNLILFTNFYITHIYNLNHLKKLILRKQFHFIKTSHVFKIQKDQQRTGLNILPQDDQYKIQLNLISDMAVLENQMAGFYCYNEKKR